MLLIKKSLKIQSQGAKKQENKIDYHGFKCYYIFKKTYKMIQKSDYAAQIRDHNLMAMMNQDESILLKAELDAIGLVQFYLARHELTPEWAKTGDRRHRMLLLWLKRIVLYILHGRLTGREIPKHIGDDYAETLTDLRNVRDGKAQLDIPLKMVEDANGTKKGQTAIRHGSNLPKHA